MVGVFSSSVKYLTDTNMKKSNNAGSCNFLPENSIDDEALGEIVKVFHYGLAGVLIYFTVAGSVKKLRYIVIIWITILVLFLINKGCIITRLERCLTGDDWTIVDPFLRALRVEKTSQNRNTLTIVGVLVMFLISAWRLSSHKKK